MAKANITMTATHAPHSGKEVKSVVGSNHRRARRGYENPAYRALSRARTCPTEQSVRGNAAIDGDDHGEAKYYDTDQEDGHHDRELKWGLLR
jgi:hypothetical protein